MGMRYVISLHHIVTTRDIPKLDAFWRHTIRDGIREKLASKPELYGKPLRNTLKGCWGLRVGDYRVIYKIETSSVRIIAVIHRSRGYGDLASRV